MNAMVSSQQQQIMPDPNLANARPNRTAVADGKGLTSPEVESRLQTDGPNDIPEEKPHPIQLFAGKFWGLSAGMLELIAVLSLFLRKTTDFAVILALLLLNGILSFVQEQRAGAAVAELRSRLQVMARVLRDGAWKTVPARELVRGDVIRLRAGDFIPADAQVCDGNIAIDQSSLTGESQEIERAVSATVPSGAIAKSGEATAIITATGKRTLYGRTTQLVANARPKLHIERVVSSLVRWLFMIVAIPVAIAVALAVPRGIPLADILPLSLVLLMGAVPVALPVMFTVSMALGSMELGRRGVLVTRLSASEDAANMDVLCADKTGTLTMNRLSFAGAEPQPGFTEDDVLREGAAASSEADQDAIDVAFLSAAKARNLGSVARTISFIPFSPQTRCTQAVVEESGIRRRMSKGALRSIAALADVDETALLQLENHAEQQARKGFRSIAVVKADGGGPYRLVGIALLADALRHDSRHLIEQLKSLGVAVKMLTGDALAVANETARSLGLGPILRAGDLRDKQAATLDVKLTALTVDGFAEVFPEDKFLVVQTLQRAGHVVGMTGDGVNDAPALHQAEVGIAVSGATDVAKSAASVVLTTEGLAGIVDLIKNGRAIYQRVLTWIVNKITQTILKTGFVVIAFLITGKFVITALGMILLLFMTDFVKIALSTDRVRPSSKPETWKIAPLVRIAVLLGLLLLVETLAVLAIGWQYWGIGADGGELQNFAFQILLFASIFSIISIRERRSFWASRPSAILAVSLVLDALAGLLIGIYGLGDMHPLPIGSFAIIAGFGAVCVLGINDAFKTRLMGVHRPSHADQPALSV
jgi:H+-transporting ATPase